MAPVRLSPRPPWYDRHTATGKPMTRIGDAEPPETEALIPVFRTLWESSMEAGLPIGCAPDVHVSLVLLPEECRGLSPKRYPLKSLKLAAISRVLRRRLERRWAKAAQRVAERAAAQTAEPAAERPAQAA